MRSGRPNYSVKASGWWTRWRGWRAQDWWSSGGHKLEQSINPSCWALGDCAAAALCVPIHQLQRLPPLLCESDQPWAKQARLSQLHGAPKYLTLCSSCTLALAPHQAKIVSAASWASREILGFFSPRWSSSTFAKDSPLFVGIWHSSDKQHWFNPQNKLSKPSPRSLA